MASLHRHLQLTQAQHDRLAFRADCPYCQRRLLGSYPQARPLSRRGEAAAAAGLVAASALLPAGGAMAKQPGAPTPGAPPAVVADGGDQGQGGGHGQGGGQGQGGVELPPLIDNGDAPNPSPVPQIPAGDTGVEVQLPSSDAPASGGSASGSGSGSSGSIAGGGASPGSSGNAGGSGANGGPGSSGGAQASSGGGSGANGGGQANPGGPRGNGGGQTASGGSGGDRGDSGGGGGGQANPGDSGDRGGNASPGGTPKLPAASRERPEPAESSPSSPSAKGERPPGSNRGSGESSAPSSASAASSTAERQAATADVARDGGGGLLGPLGAATALAHALRALASPSDSDSNSSDHATENSDSADRPTGASPTQEEAQEEPSGSDDHEPSSDATHVVQAGESLWLIAERQLDTDASDAEVAAEVERLWDRNAERIDTGNPDLIYPGQELSL